MAGRNSQISRILCLLDLLENSTSGATVSELWQSLTERGHETGKRSVYRDLEALSKAGFPLFPEGDDENNQRWTLERKVKINQYFILNSRELFALYLARGALVPLRSSPFYSDLESIFAKLEEKLGSKQVDYLESLASEIKFEPGPQWGLGLDPEVLETVRAGCSEAQVISCSYYSVNSKAESVRKLGPHYLYYANGGLYLVAEDMRDHKTKVFALPRMKSAELLGEVYKGKIQTPEDFFEGALSVFKGGEVESVTIEFEQECAQYVRERKWHPSQRVTNLSGGRIRVNFDIAATPEFYSFILGFGASAKVISPMGLAGKIMDRAQETVELYRKKAG